MAGWPLPARVAPKADPVAVRRLPTVLPAKRRAQHRPKRRAKVGQRDAQAPGPCGHAAASKLDTGVHGGIRCNPTERNRARCQTEPLPRETASIRQTWQLHLAPRWRHHRIVPLRCAPASAAVTQSSTSPVQTPAAEGGRLHRTDARAPCPHSRFPDGKRGMSWPA